MINYLSTIDKVIKEIETNKIKSQFFLGEKIETITDGIYKYSSKLDGISHIMLYSSDKKPVELIFVFDNKTLSMSKVKERFGSLIAGYNFRENYTQFSISGAWKNIEKVFFTLDNKFEISQDNILEITPYGDKKRHNDLEYDCFCIKLKKLCN